MSAVQGTPEWLAERAGCCTASRFSDVLATIKTGESASRRNYRAQLVAERLTGQPAESFTSKEMEWGSAQEPFARMAYEARSGLMVMEHGFIRHPTLPFTGCSPDGFVGEDGGFECKCPNTATHIETLLKGMPPGHIPQIQGSMWITGRAWWDFASFDPRMPERLQLYVFRVVRDEAYIKNLEAEVVKFLASVALTVKELEALSNG